ncbi:MAG TPA: hypothetical protein VHG08_02005 [Longimicrobium sp.]|nr:hypothetical protein [Longimicrobium sp.]
MIDPEEKAMRTSTGRLRMPATRTLGLRRPVGPKPSPDLRVFRVMSKLSREATRAYIDGLIGPH